MSTSLHTCVHIHSHTPEPTRSKTLTEAAWYREKAQALESKLHPGFGIFLLLVL